MDASSHRGAKKCVGVADGQRRAGSSAHLRIIFGPLAALSQASWAAGHCAAPLRCRASGGCLRSSPARAGRKQLTRRCPMSPTSNFCIIASKFSMTGRSERVHPTREGHDTEFTTRRRVRCAKELRVPGKTLEDEYAWGECHGE